MNPLILNLLNNCKTLRSLKCIHARLLIDNSVVPSEFVINKLLRLYSRFGATDFAHKVFDEITQPNAHLWTSLIHGYVETRRYDEAFSVFVRMRREPILVLNFTISAVLKALARLTRFKNGLAVYGFVLKYGFGFDMIVQNAVLDLFMRCGKVDDARETFDEMCEKDIVSWNLMISGYGNKDRVDIARNIFDRMPERNVVSWTSMICGYVKAGDMAEAQVLFDSMPVKDSASWNVMVSGYMDIGDCVNARIIFGKMPIHDTGSWNIMISGFCKAGELESAEDFFVRMPNKNVMSWGIMLDGYIKNGDIDGARCLFDQMPVKNVVIWSTMIGGYARNGQPLKALELFERFKDQDIKPDEIFILGIISACSLLGIIDAAESIIHKYVGSSLLSDQMVVTSLIDMYAKCGSIEKALQMFEMAQPKDLLCYSTMIAALANHGLGHDAILLFEKMRRANIKPDGVTFLGILTACNHGGLVDEGKKYFKQMSEEFGIQPSEKHYACVVDLLGRDGCLEEAYNLICNMPIEPHSVVWGALLAACRAHCNVELAEVVAAELFKIEPNNSGNYILLSNIYAAAGRWSSVAKVRAKIRKDRVKKNKGSSWIELGHLVHEFVIGDTSHTDSDSILLILDLLCQDMKLSAYLIDS